MARRKRTFTWQATFLGETDRPETGAAEVDGIEYRKGQPVQISPAIKRRLEGLTHLQFHFERVEEADHGN